MLLTSMLDLHRPKVQAASSSDSWHARQAVMLRPTAGHACTRVNSHVKGDETLAVRRQFGHYFIFIFNIIPTSILVLHRLKAQAASSGDSWHARQAVMLRPKRTKVVRGPRPASRSSSWRQ